MKFLTSLNKKTSLKAFANPQTPENRLWSPPNPFMIFTGPTEQKKLWWSGLQRSRASHWIVTEPDIGGAPNGWRAHGLSACDVCEQFPGTRERSPHRRNEALSAGIFLPAGKQRPLAELRHILPCSEQIV